MVTHTPYVFLDVETTGLSPRAGGRVIEVGALRVENNIVVARYKQFFHPGTTIPSFITRITGISDKDVVSAPAFEQAAREVNSLFDNAIFVAHNVNFDYGFLQSEFTRSGIQFKKDRLCTVKLSRWLYPEHKSHSLDKIIERHGFSVESRHRAYDDAEILYKFYSHLRDIDEPKLLHGITKNMTFCRNHG